MKITHNLNQIKARIGSLPKKDFIAIFFLYVVFIYCISFFYLKYVGINSVNISLTIIIGMAAWLDFLFCVSIRIATFNKRRTIQKTGLSSLIFIIIAIFILGANNHANNYGPPDSNSWLEIIFCGIFLNIYIFKIKIKELKNNYFSTKNDGIINALKLGSLIAFLWQINQISSLLTSETHLWLLCPFVLYLWHKYLQASDESLRQTILVVSGIIIAVLIYVIQTYSEDMGKKNAIYSLNRSNCLTSSNTLSVLESSELGSYTYYKFNTEGYKQNLGYIFQHEGAQSIDSYLNLISKMEYANGLSSTIIELISTSVTEDSQIKIVNSWDLAQKNQTQLKSFYREINSLCNQINLTNDSNSKW